MNGEFRELYDKLNDKFTFNEKSFIALSSLTDERWKQHDIRSIEFKQDIIEKIMKVDERVEMMNQSLFSLKDMVLNRPCQEHETETRWIKGGLYLLYTIVIGFIGFAVKLHLLP